MKLIINGKLWICFLFVAISFFLTSCSDKPAMLKRVISVKYLKKATLDTGRTFTYVAVLKIYPIEMKCNSKEKYATLYICKKISNGDTIYIFDECKEPAKFALNTKVDQTVTIVKEDVLVHNPDEIFVFVPENFKIQNNSKYLFAKLSVLEEY